MLTQDSLGPIRNDAAASRRVHRPDSPARRSGNVAADPARGTGRDRTAATADRGFATQPVRSPLRTARRRSIPARRRGPGAVAGRAGGQARRGPIIGRRAHAGYRSASAPRRTGAAQPRRTAGASAADRTGDRYRRQGLSLLRRCTACDRRRPGRDAGLRPCPVPGPGDAPAALWLPRVRGSRGASAGAGAADRRRHGDRGVAGPCAGQQIQRPPAAVSPGTDLRPSGHHAGPFHAVQLGGPRLLVAGAAAPTGAEHGTEFAQSVRR